jgi:hypothetical protein
MFQGITQSIGGMQRCGKGDDTLPALGHIAAAILLGGSVRSSEFQDAIGRSPLYLPFSDGRTILSAWCEGVRSLVPRWGTIPIRILADEAAAKVFVAPAVADVTITISRDPIEWRGTGGVLRDISSVYSADQFILVANASQVLMRPLSELVEALSALRADIAVLAHEDGTPSTMMLVRCGCLADLPDVGFVDMKEQAIPQLAEKHATKVVKVPRAIALGVRTAKSYLAALREYHVGTNGNGGAREAWRSAFSIVEDGSNVGSGARLHDSVVLRGASLGKEVVLVRSVLCGGAHVASRQIVIDKLVLSDGRQVSTEEAL